MTQYVTQKVSFTVALDLFQSFFKQDDYWKSFADWEVDAEITANLQSPRPKQDANDSIDLDTDFELDENGDLRWTAPIDGWAPRFLKEWRQKIVSYRTRLNNKSPIARYEWISLVSPIWESYPLAGEKHWRDQLRPDK